jgi:hypothetical protein
MRASDERYTEEMNNFRNYLSNSIRNATRRYKRSISFSNSSSASSNVQHGSASTTKGGVIEETDDEEYDGDNAYSSQNEEEYNEEWRDNDSFQDIEVVDEKMMSTPKKNRDVYEFNSRSSSPSSPSILWSRRRKTPPTIQNMDNLAATIEKGAEDDADRGSSPTLTQLTSHLYGKLKFTKQNTDFNLEEIDLDSDSNRDPILEKVTMEMSEIMEEIGEYNPKGNTCVDTPLTFSDIVFDP